MKKSVIKTLVLFSFVLIFTIAAFPRIDTEELESRLSRAKGQERISLLLQLSKAYKTQSPAKSYEYGKEALELLKEFPDLQRQWSLLNHLSYISARLGKCLEAKDYAGLSLSLAREMKNRKNIAKSLFHLGEAYRCSNNFDKALETFKQSMQIYQEINDIKGLSIIYNSMGLTYWELDDYPKVLEHYFQSLKFKKELDDKEGIAVVQLNIGRVYWKLKNFPLSLEYYSKAKDFFEEVGNNPLLGAIYNNIAAVYILQGKYPEALTSLEKSLEFKKKSGIKPLIASTLNNIGDLYERTGDIEKAENYYTQSLAIYEEINNKQGICMGLLNLGSIYRQTRRYQQAIQQLNQALAIAKEINKKDFINYSYSILSQTYADKKNYKKALEYHQKFKENSDSIFNEQTARKIADIQKNYEVEKREKEITLLKKDQEIQKLAFSRQQSIKNFLIIVSALILLLAFVIYTRYRLKVKVMKKLEKEMEQRKKAEDELVKSRKLESIAILAGGIAHDFNNLLTVILGSVSMVKEKIRPLGIDTPNPLHEAEKASLQAADLIKKFISFSSGGWIKGHKINIPDFLNNISQQSGQMKNIQVLIDPPPENLKPIYGDQQKLQQVFFNLLNNADEAAANRKPGTVIITTRNIALDKENRWHLQPGEYVNVSIVDSGKGIPPQIMEKIFDPYFSTKERGSQKGMGLGLTICYAIIKKHNGHISVTSDIDKGTTVDIYLPAFLEAPA